MEQLFSFTIKAYCFDFTQHEDSTEEEEEDDDDWLETTVKKKDQTRQSEN